MQKKQAAGEHGALLIACLQNFTDTIQLMLRRLRPLLRSKALSPFPNISVMEKGLGLVFFWRSWGDGSSALRRVSTLE
jgi:hypothetical protein